MQAIKVLLQQINQFMKAQGINGTVTYKQETSHMVRCGRSQISLNVSEQGEKYFIELQQGKRKITGSTTAQVDDIDKLKALVLSLHKNLSFMPEVAHLQPLTAIAQSNLDTSQIDPVLLNLDSSIMVSLFKQCADRFKDENAEISGAFSAGIQRYAIINTLVEEAQTYQGSDYNIEMVLQLLDHDKKEIRVSDVGRSLAQFDSDKLIDHLAKMHQIKTTTPLQDITPGEYDVVFYADAFSDLTSYMSSLTLSGKVSYLFASRASRGR